MAPGWRSWGWRPALAYATRWPRLRPKVFGYHELFHLLTLIAAVLHFVTVVLVSRTAFR